MAKRKADNRNFLDRWETEYLFTYVKDRTEKLSVLGAEFSRRFADFDVQKCRFELLSNPFAVNVENAPTNLQMELIELQCNDTLKSKYDAVGAAQFSTVPDTMPELRTQTAQLAHQIRSVCSKLSNN